MPIRIWAAQHSTERYTPCSMQTLLTGLLVIAVLFPGSPVSDEESWCSAVRMSSEPAVIVYNRVPKCGSTTTKGLMRNIATSRQRYAYTDVPKSFWGSYSNSSRRSELYHYLSGVYSKRHAMIVSGHIYDFQWNESALLGMSARGRIEFMQVVRECESRLESHFHMTLHELQSSTAGEIEHGRAHRLHFNDSCMSNISCLAEQAIFKEALDSNIVWRYMASNGSDGIPSDQEELIRKAINPELGKYMSFGLTEHLKEYLEMLECLYPSAFYGVVRLYNNRRFNKLSVGHHPTDSVRNAVHELAVERCKGGSDSKLYRELLSPVFWRRYNLMKAHPDKCCRARHKIRI